MAGVIVPNRYISQQDIKGPLIFLAGPIRGAPVWQDQAIDMLISADPEVTVVTPRRGVRSNFSEFVLEESSARYFRQREFEWDYMLRAGEQPDVQGAIMFWLPEECDHSCEKAYGAMTRVELGQWMTRYQFNPGVRFCLGTDNKFSEIDTILYDLSRHAPNKTAFFKLRETCEEALRIARAA